MKPSPRQKAHLITVAITSILVFIPVVCNVFFDMYFFFESALHRILFLPAYLFFIVRFLSGDELFAPIFAVIALILLAYLIVVYDLLYFFIRLVVKRFYKKL
ncbi:MAG: hypothetical protein V2A54_06550 [Bacteroidota bacterium]